MKTIYQYPVEIAIETHVKMPKDAKILTVKMQDGRGVVWALVDPLVTREETRVFHFVMTGEEVTDEFAETARYVTTMIALNGIVAHVFETDTVGSHGHE